MDYDKVLAVGLFINACLWGMILLIQLGVVRL